MMTSKTNMPPVVVIGFGGHGRVVTDALLAAGRKVVAVTDRKTDDPFAKRIGMPLLTDESLLERHPPGTVDLASGLGSIWPCGAESHRRSVVRQLEHSGYRFTGFIHPAAWVSPWAVVDPTAQIHAGAVIQPGAQIGPHSIINTAASVDHDGDIGCFCHIGPGATLSGNVRIGDGSHLGTGCALIQGIVLGPGCFVAAGSTVVQDVPSGNYVRGTPAKSFQPRARS
jgi:sugar O-acyltransferase (sialic acid O-acetyltransferase NeuD family)